MVQSLKMNICIFSYGCMRHPFVMKLICPVLLPERSDGLDRPYTFGANFSETLQRFTSYIQDERVYPTTLPLLFQE